MEHGRADGGPVSGDVVGGSKCGGNCTKDDWLDKYYPSGSGDYSGDYSADTPVLATLQKRPIRTIIHSSGNLEEAEFEMKLWFKEKEIYDYKKVGEDL